MVSVEIGSGLVESRGNTKIGLGISYSLLLDGLLWLAVLLTELGLLVPERLTGRTQGILMPVVSALLATLSLSLILAAVAGLTEMVTLLITVPFGTIAYLIAFGSFDRSAAAIALSLIMTLKLVLAGCLVLTDERFLENKKLIALMLTSIVATLIVIFLHGIVPAFLASITDAIAAIVVGILALAWAIWFFLRSIPAVVKVVA